MVAALKVAIVPAKSRFVAPMFVPVPYVAVLDTICSPIAPEIVVPFETALIWL